MSPDAAIEITKFLVGAASVVGSILGTAKIVGAALVKNGNPTLANPVYEARFQEGERRMATMETRLKDHDTRFSAQDREHAELRVELAGLRPHFENMKEAVGVLGRQAREMEGTLTTILGRIPPDE